MKISAAIFCAICLLTSLLVGESRAADNTLRYSAEVPFRGDIALPRGHLSASIFFDVTIEISTLLGEPVVNCVAQLSDIPANSLQLIAKLPQGERVIVLDKEQTQTITFYGLELWLHPAAMAYGERRIYCDAGVVGNGAVEPFNVAGSPDWDRFICAGTYANSEKCGEGQGVYWKDAEDAKDFYRLMQEAGSRGNIEIHTLRANASDLITDLIEAQLADGTITAYEKLLDEILPAIIAEDFDGNPREEMLKDDPEWNSADPLTRANMLVTMHNAFLSEEKMREVGASEEDIALLNKVLAPLRERHLAEDRANQEMWDQWASEIARVTEASTNDLADYRKTLEAKTPLIPTQVKDGPRNERGWYYVDSRGNRVLGPYRKAEPFTADGYAAVNSTKAIDRSGKVLVNSDGITIAHGHLAVAYNGKSKTRDVIDIPTGKVLIASTKDKIEADVLDGKKVFKLVKKTVLGRKEHDCHNDGWEKYRLDTRIFDTEGVLVGEQSEEREVALPVGLCLKSTRN